MELDENARSGDSLPRASTRSRIPGASSLPRLQEITESENNARTPTCMPPPATSQKHRPVGLPEPASKQRKTLAAQAGEPYVKSGPASSTSRPANGAVRVPAAAGFRGNSFSSANSSRFPSTSSRNTSNSSLSSVRHHTAGSNYRSQSALSVGRPQFSALNGAVRPRTSMESHGDPNASDNKHDGMTLLSRSPSPSFESFVQVGKRRQRGGAQKIMNHERTCSKDNHESTVRQAFRDVSVSSAMQGLSIGNTAKSEKNEDTNPNTPSYLPVPVAKDLLCSPVQNGDSLSPKKSQKSPRKSLSPTKAPLFLSKSSNVQAASWDIHTRFEGMEKQFGTFKEQLDAMSQEQINVYKARVNELEDMRTQMLEDKSTLKSEVEELKTKLHSTTVALEDSRRSHSLELDDIRRKHRNGTEDMREDYRRREEKYQRDAQDELEKLCRRHGSEIEELERKLKTELEDDRTRRVREVEDLSMQLSQLRQNADIDASSRERESQNIKAEMNQLNTTIEQERIASKGLKEKLTQAASVTAQLEVDLEAARAKSRFLESDSQAQSQAFADLNARMQEAIESAAEANSKLRAEESLRRKLHNQVQELKGNIRVFCRVRPTLPNEEDPARIAFPDDQEDCKEIVVTGPEKKSAVGNDATSKHSFSFDRVFSPRAANPEVFDEISQLVQSALDGYNVCIFCYGQTGSGKTYTMSSTDGMIPLAVKQIYDTAHSLKEKGWSYDMAGSFIEVYNENLNDLLGKAEDFDKKRHEIRHDQQRCKTAVTDVEEVVLDSPDTVATLLQRASKNRSVAATKANERSSRGHSVFILKLTGSNSITGERSEGTLNLVDLAGSERLTHSGATGDRLKETQSINRSLSCLGDVIAALGQGKEGTHIPYRNSKLTYLLQHSLGGNSKTLMFVMASPLVAHLGETVTSLKFATKVGNTHIGTARQSTRVKD